MGDRRRRCYLSDLFVRHCSFYRWVMLTQNSELRPHGIFNWSIPAWYTRLDDGSIFKTCPNAGACATVCYARNGTYRFRNVADAHRRNLTTYLDDPETWVQMMIAELSHKKFRPTGVSREIDATPDDRWLRAWIRAGGKAVRIHDSGDFFSRAYLDSWITVAEAIPDVLFYAYTKEISMFRSVEHFPINFRYLFSYGGREDHLIGDDRHADVFPDRDTLEAAGYADQEANDLLAILLPTNRIGIVSNNIPAFRKKLAGRRFSELRSTQTKENT